MANRKTVNINIDATKKLIANNGWSNVYFSSTLMSKNRGWITEWMRGRNLPSPEEAAQMCILLNTTPEEILLSSGETEPETEKMHSDIALVKSLIGQKSAQKTPDPETEGISPAKRELLSSIDDLTDDQCIKLLGIIAEAKKLL